MDLEKENKVLKDLVIFLAQCYQENYNKFASSLNYSTELKQSVSEETYNNIIRVFMNFSTVQGSQFRDLIEEIATRSITDRKLDLDLVKELFQYEEKEAATKRRLKYSPSNQAEVIEKIKDMWEK